MKRLYLIRTEDIFEAIKIGQFSPDKVFLEVGSIWATVDLTDDERSKYTFPISLLWNINSAETTVKSTSRKVALFFLNFDALVANGIARQKLVLTWNSKKWKELSIFTVFNPGMGRANGKLTELTTVNNVLG
jgi:hypothetical protein